MRCSRCGAELNPNAYFCIKCGARVLAQNNGAGAQSTNNNNIYGSSDPVTASFDGPGQRNGMGQHAGSRDSQMTAAYSNVGENPANNPGNESTSAYGNVTQGGNGYSNRGSGPYASDPGNDPNGP